MTITKSSAARTAASPLRRLIAPALAALFVFGLLLGTPHAHADQWYFKKTDDHTQPPLDSAQERIASCNGYYVNQKATDEKVIYLTFDAGYENGNVNAILNILDKHRAPGAFFVLEHFVRDHPELIQKMDILGCEVCNHTCSHADMSAADRATFENELKNLESICMELTQVPMAPFYRPPEGKYSLENLQWAQEMGYATVFWSFAYADWDNDKQPDPKQSLQNLLDHVHNGEILLLHPTSSTNAAILDDFLTQLEKQGYRFGKLAELTATKQRAE